MGFSELCDRGTRCHVSLTGCESSESVRGTNWSRLRARMAASSSAVIAVDIGLICLSETSNLRDFG